MPRLYKRKKGVKARVISWTSEQLQSAFEEIDKNKLGINEISRRFGISSRTLRRRYATRNKTQLTQGKHPVLGFENEKTLSKLILKLCDIGFPPNKISIRKLAYNFAEKRQINHNFDKKQQMAGNQWLKSFIERNSDLSIIQTRCLFVDTDKSISSNKDLRDEELNRFYELLIKVLSENDLKYKPERIYNMDELILQFNNKPENSVPDESAKEINSLRSEENDTIVTVIACCNVIGNFLPPVIITKGMNKEPKFHNTLPLGSKMYMSKDSAHINTNLFFKWFREHFIDLKPRGKVLLILDEHLSHSSAPDLLQTASDNDVILLCLPSHSILFQPIDVAVLKPFQAFFNNEINEFMNENPNISINTYNSGKFIRNAWMHAATPANAIDGFKKSGIYPANYNVSSDTSPESDSESDIAHCSYNDKDQLFEQHDSKIVLPHISSKNENTDPFVNIKVEPKTEDPLFETFSNDFISEIETKYDINYIQQRCT